MFDIDGDGVPEQISWTEADSDVAFLALDRDGDGRITSGKELFGNHTLPGVTRSPTRMTRVIASAGSAFTVTCAIATANLVGSVIR